MVDIGSLEGKQTAPVDLNEKIHVVGWSDSKTEGGWRAFVWIPNEGMKDLGTLPGGGQNQALAINEKGWVVGGPGPFLWKPKLGLRNLGVLPGFQGDGYANQVNDQGEVLVGFSRPGPRGKAGAIPSLVKPYLWTGYKGYRELPIPSGYEDVRVEDLNNQGQIILRAGKLPERNPEGFLVEPGAGGMEKLLVPPGWDHARYKSINDKGWLTRLDHLSGSVWLPYGKRLDFQSFALIPLRSTCPP